MTMQCPQCGSHNTQTFEMAHLSGARSGSIRGGAYSPSGNVYFQSARIESSSQLAQATAPPRRPKFRDGIMQIGIVFGALAYFPSFFLVYFALPYLMETYRLINFGHLNAGEEADFRALSYIFLPFAISVGIISVAAILRSSGYNKEKINYQSNFQRWSESKICLRCGNRWRS